MWKSIGVLVLVLGFAVWATPAAASVIYTPMTGYTHGVGLYNPADPGTLNTVYVTSGSGVPPSAMLTFTFAMHHTDAFYRAQSLHFTFMYDNTSLELVHMIPIGESSIPPGRAAQLIPWETNYASQTAWPNPSTGIVQVTSLSQWFPTSVYLQMNTTSIVPFMQVQLHVKSAVASQVNAFGIVAMTFVSHLGTTFDLAPGDFAYGLGQVHEVPEPATITLLGAAIALITGRVVRRRARAS